MGRLKYIITRIAKMDYKSMLTNVEQIHKNTGKSRAWLFCDMVKCGFKYGTGYKDYRLCEWWTLTDAQRATYVTRGINNAIVAKMNDPEYYHFLDNKADFNRLYAAHVGRKWLDMSSTTPEEFEAFMADLDVIISKPVDATCGQGIEKLYKKDFASVAELYKYLKGHGCGLAEECVVQHEAISKLYPHSVNTLRIVTIFSKGEAHVVYAFIRIGNFGKCVDNINSGGMAAPIDLETGCITYPAYDKDFICYDRHPMTDCPIVGYKIPLWSESLQLALDSAKVLPQLGYIAWDVAVTANGPVLIEGNQFPGHDILQMPAHVPDKIGMLPRFREFIEI